MLKLTDDGAKITLQDQPKTTDDGMFWFGSALLIGAVAVAIAMSLLPERLAIGALALLIIKSANNIKKPRLALSIVAYYGYVRVS